MAGGGRSAAGGAGGGLRGTGCMGGRRGAGGGEAGAASGGLGRPVVFRGGGAVVREVLGARGARATESETDWDVHWADTHWVADVFPGLQLAESQRVNHFVKHQELTRKDLLVKNLKRTRKALEREQRWDEAAGYDFFPTTFSLPADYSLFVEEFKAQGGVWIAKPTGRAQGRGIFLFDRLAQVADWSRRYRGGGGGRGLEGERVENYVVQRYVERPYLLGGKKFDLRIYALVTSFSPLRVHLHRGGFARFSAQRFSMDRRDISDNLIHLTNVAVQREGTRHAEDGVGGGSGGGVGGTGPLKWDIRSLRLHMGTRHGADTVTQLFSDIEEVVVRSLLAAQSSVIHDRRCFELYGYDIIIDEGLKPWLLEINASPSLSADSEEDYLLKFGMLDDVFDILDVEQRRGGGDAGAPPPSSLGGFDLIWDGGPPAGGPRAGGPAVPESRLGCLNARWRGRPPPPRLRPAPARAGPPA